MKKKSYINIGRWWLKDGLGRDMTVNSIWTELKGTENEISRYALAKAKDGELEKADIYTLEILARLCSQWSGKDISVDDLIDSNQETANFKTPIAA